MKTVFKTKLLAIFAVALVLIIASVLMSACGGHTHKFGEWTEHEADCENPGWQERKCECGETEKQTLESKPALGHTEVIDEAKEATCLEAGKTEGKHCSVCNKTLAEQTEIPAKGHTEVKHEAKAPTCTEKGNDAYVTCSSCDYTTFKELPAKGHTEVKHEAKAPTCTEKGNDAYVTCSSCDYTTFKELPAKGHTEVKLEAVAAKCTADGKTEGKKCSVCNVVLTAQTVVPAKGHVCDEKVWEYNGAQHYRKCTVCSESYNFADHKITVGVCSCGYKIPVSECKHDYTLTLVSGKPATCTEDGVKEHYVCPYCNEWFEDAQAKNKITDRASVTLPATKHVEAVEMKAVSPTCYSVGYTEKVICAVCETVIKESVELPAAEHTAVTDAAVAPTCVTEGKTEGSYCSVCSAVLTAQTTVAATGVHEYEKTEEKAPNCTENGYISYKCKTCISVKETSLAATGHTVSIDAEWTEVKGEDGEPILTPVADQKCVFEGTKVSTCAACGGQVSEKYTTVKHSYIGKITQASTCQAEGVKTYTCSVCEAQYTESVAKDANAHSWTAQPTDGKYTCTVNGCGSTKVVVDHTDKTTAGIDKDTLNGAKDNDLEVNLKDATIKIDSSIVNELGEKGDEVDLSADKLDDGVRNEIISNIDEATKELIGDKPIYDFNLTVNDQKVIFEGNMTVTLPYDLKEGEDTESIVVAYISDDGKVELIPAAYTEIGGKGYVTFVTDHFSHFTTAQVEGSVRCQVYGHEYYEVKAQATCLTSGYTTRFCHYCGESDPEIYDVVAAKGHNYKHDETASTCIAQGYVTSTCLDCGYTVVNGYTDFADHKFVISETVEPSCISEGYSIENCSVCGYSRKSAFVPLLMHEFGDAEVTKAPTCTEAGELTAKCTREGCDAKKVTLSSPAGHVLTAVPGVSPTCTEAGAAGGIGCAVCNELLVQGEVIPAAGHTEQTIAKIEPSCTEAGKTEGKICSVCGEILQAVADIAPVGHKEVTDAAIEATCVKPGLTEGKHCSVCNATIVQQTETPLKSHTFDDKYDTSCNVCGFIRDAECAHKNTETLAGVAPTCTKAGLSEGKKCADCGETLVDQKVVEALGHKEDILPAVEPTCTEAGKTEGKYCSVCNATLAEQTVVDALGHKEEILPAVEPTCTAVGKTEGKYCTVCNETLAEQTVIEALGHKEEILPAVEPTCTAVGKTEGKYCSVCNETLAEQTVIEALGHKEEILHAVEPTCTEAGKTEGKYCAVCNATLAEQTVIEALGHKEIFMPEIEPTCAKVGFSAGAFCEVCKETLVERVVIAQLPHDYYDVAGLEPTCESSGWTPHKECKECGHKDGYEVLRQLIHIEKAVSRVYPTCTEAGLEKYIVCELCGIYITEPVVIPALGHAYVDGACVRCGEKDPNYKCEHKWGEWEQIQESTCQIKGEDMRRCLICGEEEFKYYPLADHWMIKIQIIEPTCTKDGFIERECNWCKTLTQEYTKSLGHSFIDGICGRCKEKDPSYECKHEWGAWEILVPSNCEKAGRETHSCLICGYREDRQLPGVPHNYVSGKFVAATCTVDGFEELYCSMCKDTQMKIIKAFGHKFENGICVNGCGMTEGCKEHKWSPWEVRVEPICEADGLEVRYCYNCKIEEHNKLPKLIHLYNTLAYVPATCTADGYEDLRCLHCGDTYRENIAALGHDFRDGKCTLCGEYEKVCEAHVWGEWKITVPANCQMPGEERRYCVNCYKEDFRSIPMTDHNFIKLNIVKPTCTTDGFIESGCINCTVRTQEFTPMIPHDFVIGKIVAATCTMNGSEERYCTMCMESYTEIIYAYGHKYENGNCLNCGELEPGAVCKEHVWGEWKMHTMHTCYKDGVNVRYCQKCKMEEREVLPMLPHDFVTEKIVEATCTMEGYEEIRCKMCNELRKEIFKAYGHSFEGGKCIRCGEAAPDIVCKEHKWSGWEIRVAPTCYKDGLEVKYCYNCKVEEQRILPIISHNYISINRIPPTCTEEGLDEMYCEMCKEKRTEILRPFEHWYIGGKCMNCGEPEPVCKDHKWSEWEIRLAPTCHNDGVEARFCYNCKQEEQKNIPMLVHNFKVNKSVEPTCTQNGFVEEMCYMCGEMRWEDIPSFGHHFIPGAYVPPTCMEPGFEEHSCINCKEVLRNDFAPFGHNFLDGKCVNCGELESGAVCKEHVWGEWKMHTMHTCYKDGVNVRYCQKCMLEEREVLPMLPHDFVTEKIVEATCTMEGYEEIRCKMCNELRKEIFKAYGHSFEGGKCIRCGEAEAEKECEIHIWGMTETVVPATCDTDGIARRVCMVCGNETILAIAKMGHQFKIVNEVNPTCTQAGSRVVVCDMCGENQNLVIPKLNHNVVDGVCIMCNEKFVIFDGGEWSDVSEAIPNV